MTTAIARERVAALHLPGVRLGALPAEPVRRLPTGVPQLDELLGGGLPRGYVSELVGGPSSGRTAVLHALVASATRRGEVAAVIDLGDTLDPPSLAGAGADLRRVLWVRPPSAQIALKCAELVLSAGGFGMVTLDGLGAGRPVPRQVWPRLAQVARRAGAACLVCASHRLAHGAAAMALTVSQHRVRWEGRLLEGVISTAVLARSRFGPAERAVTLAMGARWVGGGEGSDEPTRWRRRGGGEEADDRVTG